MRAPCAHALCRWSPEQFLAVIAQVDNYSSFVPWCQASRVLKREPNYLEAELVVGFQMLTEKCATTASPCITAPPWSPTQGRGLACMVEAEMGPRLHAASMRACWEHRGGM